jgi:hypothetical protein
MKYTMRTAAMHRKKDMGTRMPAMGVVSRVVRRSDL